MPSIFTKIIQREIPGYIIAENQNCIAFLDIMPLVEGHVLVVPKMEIDYIFDLPPSLLSELMIFSQSIAKSIEHVIPCKRVGVAVIGLEVPHAHLHLVPLQHVQDINFSRPKITVTPERMKEIQQNLFNNIKHQHS